MMCCFPKWVLGSSGIDLAHPIFIWLTLDNLDMEPNRADYLNEFQVTLAVERLYLLAIARLIVRNYSYAVAFY